MLRMRMKSSTVVVVVAVVLVCCSGGSVCNAWSWPSFGGTEPEEVADNMLDEDQMPNNDDDDGEESISVGNTLFPHGWKTGFSFMPAGHDVLPAARGIALGEAIETCRTHDACEGVTFAFPHGNVNPHPLSLEGQRAQLLPRVVLTPAEGEALNLGMDTLVDAHYKSGKATLNPYSPDWVTVVSPDWVHPGESVSLYNDAYVDISPQEVLMGVGDQDEFAHARVMHQDPAVVVVDDFLTPEEIEVLVGMGEDMGYATSKTLNYENPNLEYTSSYRTSWTAHCNETCREHPLVLGVRERLARLTQTNLDNSEPLQFTRYFEGQEFKTHSDYISRHLDSPAGARIFTVFVYLVQPKEGGHTKFPALGISVAPVAGRAVVWANVKEGVDEEHPLTTHAGTPVGEGVKVGMNVWIHRASYTLAYEVGLG